MDVVSVFRSDCLRRSDDEFSCVVGDSIVNAHGVTSNDMYFSVKLSVMNWPNCSVLLLTCSSLLLVRWSPRGTLRVDLYIRRQLRLLEVAPCLLQLFLKNISATPCHCRNAEKLSRSETVRDVIIYCRVLMIVSKTSTTWPFPSQTARSSQDLWACLKDLTELDELVCSVSVCRLHDSPDCFLSDPSEGPFCIRLYLRTAIRSSVLTSGDWLVVLGCRLVLHVDCLVRSFLCSMHNVTSQCPFCDGISTVSDDWGTTNRIMTSASQCSWIVGSLCCHRLEGLPDCPSLEKGHAKWQSIQDRSWSFLFVILLSGDIPLPVGSLVSSSLGLLVKWKTKNVDKSTSMSRFPLHECKNRCLRFR